MDISPDFKLISYCGLYCGNCKKYKAGRCPGCADNEKAKWCKIRTCCKEKGYVSCADCPEETVNNCKNINNLIGKFFAVVFNSDRKAGLSYIRDNGYNNFVTYMTEKNIMAMPRKKRR
ncbi:MAG: DUF3795 domain-containing protein [Bacteroidales bacterium]|jgi:hypothetical protein|nr:DUF3795 domain-containing protein [Bacteroidales bacterium]